MQYIAEQLEKRRLLWAFFEGYPDYWYFEGTADVDDVYIECDGTNTYWLINGVSGSIQDLAFVNVQTFGGNDTVCLSFPKDGPEAGSIVLGNGDDTGIIIGGGAIWGDAGNDELELYDAFRGEIRGGDGNDDMLIGGTAWNCEIDGEGGNDEIIMNGALHGQFAKGGAGNDTLVGGWGEDQLFGDAGNDYLHGGPGAANDIIYSDDGEIDTLVGGLGTDFGYVDWNDVSDLENVA